MIAILTDKPSVGKEIGRIIGATRVRNGYVEGMCSKNYINFTFF